ncbi:hypothetical protein M433DRAFT_160112 [Acidomyces richmondensis BFW]|nr:MAG: hypothetical protein FE78DRAFT_89774 [Acidomyces sp. 'richmondensis']KYG40654.1 hypothetical protein M433DRAFT_160112 [Acidomyces richmondensis BFW]
MMNTSVDPASVCCPWCGRKDNNLYFYITRTSNRNGNAGRPYVKCGPCQKFITFQDNRGVHLDNPKCKCETPARLQVAGKFQKVKPRGLHYVCSTGGCNHYSVAKNELGRQYSLSDDLLTMFVNLKLI